MAAGGVVNIVEMVSLSVKIVLWHLVVVMVELLLLWGRIEGWDTVGVHDIVKRLIIFKMWTMRLILVYF